MVVLCIFLTFSIFLRPPMIHSLQKLNMVSRSLTYIIFNFYILGVHRRTGLERGEVLPAKLPLADPHQTLPHRGRVPHSSRIEALRYRATSLFKISSFPEKKIGLSQGYSIPTLIFYFNHWEISASSERLLVIT